MGWLFSEAMMKAYVNSPSSLEREEEFSEATCSDGEQCAPSSGLPIQQAYCSHDKMTEFSRLSRFGMTFKPLTADRGEELLTLYLEASRAKTSAQPEAARASKASAAECGSTWPALSVKYDPASSSWKTAHCLWEEDLQWSSVTLPTWGMTRSGFVYRHPTAERPISATAAGSSAYLMGLTMNPTHWPTPLANSHNGPGHPATKQGGMNLQTAVRQWPTPVTSMAKGSSPASLTRKNGQDRSNDRLDHAAMASDGGQLNPQWVEWLMGWPLGWTDLKPLAMDRFREWQRQHSHCWPDYREAA